jgi:hypothetical protein
MTTVKWIAQGDTAPSLQATLEDVTGAAVDLQGAQSVEVLLWDAFTSLLVLDQFADNDQFGDGSDGSKGKVHYEWIEGDMEVAGAYRGRFITTYQDGSVESFPNAGPFDVIVTFTAREIAS